MINNFYRFWNYSSYTHTHTYALSNYKHSSSHNQSSVSNVRVEGRSYFTTHYS